MTLLKYNNSVSNNISPTLSKFLNLYSEILKSSDNSKIYTVSIQSALEVLSDSCNSKGFVTEAFPALAALTSSSNIAAQKRLLQNVSLIGHLQSSNLISSALSLNLSNCSSTIMKDFSNSISKAILQAEETGFNLQESIKIIHGVSKDFLETQKQFDITSEERENIEHNKISHEQYVELSEDTFKNISDTLIPSDAYFSIGPKQILVKKSFYDFYCQCLLPTLTFLVALITLFVNSSPPGSINNYPNTMIEQNATIINNYFNIDDIDFENRTTDSDHQNKILIPDSDPEDFDSIPEPESESVDNNP